MPRRRLRNVRGLKGLVASLESWYLGNGRDLSWRRRRLNPYQNLVLETLLWKTRAESVERMYEKFLASYPDPESLSRANVRTLERRLKPLGLYRRRARSMKELGKMLSDHPELPPEYEQLVKLQGIGQYSARATLCFSFRLPVIPVDGNVRRVLERALGHRVENIRVLDDPTEALLDRLASCADSPQRLTYALLDLSSLLCLPKVPRCGACPVSGPCLFHRKAREG